MLPLNNAAKAAQPAQHINPKGAVFVKKGPGLAANGVTRALRTSIRGYPAMHAVQLPLLENRIAKGKSPSKGKPAKAPKASSSTKGKQSKGQQLKATTHGKTTTKTTQTITQGKHQKGNTRKKSSKGAPKDTKKDKSPQSSSSKKPFAPAKSAKAGSSAKAAFTNAKGSSKRDSKIQASARGSKARLVAVDGEEPVELSSFDAIEIPGKEVQERISNDPNAVIAIPVQLQKCANEKGGKRGHDSDIKQLEQDIEDQKVKFVILKRQSSYEGDSRRPNTRPSPGSGASVRGKDDRSKVKSGGAQASGS